MPENQIYMLNIPTAKHLLYAIFVLSAHPFAYSFSDVVLACDMCINLSSHLGYLLITLLMVTIKLI